MVKDDWERPGDQYTISAENVRGIIDSVFPGAYIKAFERLNNGFSNSNYKLSLEGFSSPLVIRLYNGNKGVATKEQKISRLVSSTVPVAAFVHVDESCSLLEVPFAILEWKDGVLLSQLMRNKKEMFQSSAAKSVGEVLAEIHKYRFTGPGFLNKQLEIEKPVFIDEEQILSIIASFLDNRCGYLLGERLSNAVLTFCRRQSHNLSGSDEDPVLVHSDYNGLNILMKEDAGRASVSAILDWEYAFSGSRFADIGNILRYEEESSEFENHFLNGYESNGGILKDNWRLLSKLHDLVALCDLLNRSTNDAPKRVQDLKHLIRQTVT